MTVYAMKWTREEKLSKWGEGPWVDEPDRLEFRHRGLPCLITRHELMGNLCGYVAVPPGHPWHSKSDPPVSVHGNCNYANACSGHICHVAEPGEPDNVWWFGFDCSHGHDFVPGYVRAFPPALLPKLFSTGVYRDLQYVDKEVRAMAEQLHALSELDECNTCGELDGGHRTGCPNRGAP